MEGRRLRADLSRDGPPSPGAVAARPRPQPWASRNVNRQHGREPVGRGPPGVCAARADDRRSAGIPRLEGGMMRSHRTLVLLGILGAAAVGLVPGCAKKEAAAPAATETQASAAPANGGKIPITTSSEEE